MTVNTLTAEQRQRLITVYRFIIGLNARRKGKETADRESLDSDTRPAASDPGTEPEVEA